MRKGSVLQGKPRSKVHNFINQETVSALQEEIEYLWSVYRIEPYYQKAYFESLSRLHITTYIQFLAKEIENLYNEKSSLQQLYAVIRKREEHIRALKEFDILLEPEEVTEQVKEKVLN